MTRTGRWLAIVALALLAVLVVAVSILASRWQERPEIDDLGWPVASPGTESADRVTVTWLGISTLLFDDGETQILTDGTFSRPSIFDLVTQRKIWSDIATINHSLARFRIDRLAAIIPLHSHFDHAMDAGYVANRTSAVILGSESTANIARGANVPVSQYQILASGETRQFGEFTITLIASRHAPIGMGGEPPIPGTIDQPLQQPVRPLDYREGGTWSVLISHPQGTTLVQGSGGFIENTLPEDSADVVMLGVAGLSRLGRDYVGQYWRETVLRTNARRVYPVHIEDFSRPYGEIALFPDWVDDISETASWISALAAQEEPRISVERLPFGQPVIIFPRDESLP